MKNENSLKEKWANFRNAFLGPIPVFCILGGAILLIISILYKDKVEFSVLINLVGSLLFGIAGAFIKTNYDNLSSESVLIKKGLSATRNLNSIGQQIIKIKEWAKCFMSSKKDLTERSLEEIIRHLSTTEMNVRCGIDDWTDIIPELKEEKEKNIEELKKYEEAIRAYREELFKIKKQILTKRDGDERKELEKKIKELEKEMKGLKRESPQVFDNAIMGPFIGKVDFNPTALNNKICNFCGKFYAEDYSHAYLVGNICPECREKKFGSNDSPSVVVR